jgi:hypothetical protein
MPAAAASRPAAVRSIPAGGRGRAVFVCWACDRWVCKPATMSSNGSTSKVLPAGGVTDTSEGEAIADVDYTGRRPGQVCRGDPGIETADRADQVDDMVLHFDGDELTGQPWIVLDPFDHLAGEFDVGSAGGLDPPVEPPVVRRGRPHAVTPSLSRSSDPSRMTATRGGCSAAL